MSPFSICTPAATDSVCVEFNAHAYVCGVVIVVPSTFTWSPTGFEVTVTSNPVGLQVKVDGTTITTPQTYAWALNSTHTLSVAAGVQMLNGDIAGSTTSATFYYTYGRWND